MRRLIRRAGRRHGEPLTPGDWQAYFEFSTITSTRAVHRVLRSLPASPRCGMCGAPFVGNIGGGTAVSDFTAIGDVVNTAARLQSCARSGEVMVAERLARFLDEPAGLLERVTVKGKHEPVAAQRVRWFETPKVR